MSQPPNHPPGGLSGWRWEYPQAAPPTMPTGQQPPQGTGPAGPQEPGGNKGIVHWIVGAMVVFALVFSGAAYLITQDDDNDTATSQTGEEEGLGSRLPGDPIPGEPPGSPPGTTAGTPDTTGPPTTEPPGSGSASSNSPEGTLQAFADALNQKDCQAAIGLGTDESFEEDGGREAALADCEDSFNDPTFDLSVTVDDVETVEETDTTAVVQASVTFDVTFSGNTSSETTNDTIHMALQSDAWLIDEWETG